MEWLFLLNSELEPNSAESLNLMVHSPFLLSGSLIKRPPCPVGFLRKTILFLLLNNYFISHLYLSNYRYYQKLRFKLFWHLYGIFPFLIYYLQLSHECFTGVTSVTPLLQMGGLCSHKGIFNTGLGNRDKHFFFCTQL